MYSLEELIKTFAEHAEKAEDHKEEMLKSYKQEYPGEEIPDHMLDPFNICLAFHSMCMEIKKLKDMSR